MIERVTEERDFPCFRARAFKVARISGSTLTSTRSLAPFGQRSRGTSTMVMAIYFERLVNHNNAIMHTFVCI